MHSNKEKTWKRKVYLQKQIKFPKIIGTTSSSTVPQTDFITETMSVFFVKWVMPRNPFICCKAIVMAAPPINPTMAAWDKKSMRKPNLSTSQNQKGVSHQGKLALQTEPIMQNS